MLLYMAPEHGLKGKTTNHARSHEKDASVEAVFHHLDEHCDLGEPSATRIVRDAKEETHLCDHKDTAIYLPMVLSKMKLYHRYCEENG